MESYKFSAPIFTEKTKASLVFLNALKASVLNVSYIFSIDVSGLHFLICFIQNF